MNLITFYRDINYYKYVCSIPEFTLKDYDIIPNNNGKQLRIKIKDDKQKEIYGLLTSLCNLSSRLYDQYINVVLNSGTYTEFSKQFSAYQIIAKTFIDLEEASSNFVQDTYYQNFENVILSKCRTRRYKINIGFSSELEKIIPSIKLNNPKSILIPCIENIDTRALIITITALLNRIVKIILLLKSLAILVNGLKIDRTHSDYAKIQDLKKFIALLPQYTKTEEYVKKNILPFFRTDKTRSNVSEGVITDMVNLLCLPNNSTIMTNTAEGFLTAISTPSTKLNYNYSTLNNAMISYTRNIIIIILVCILSVTSYVIYSHYGSKKTDMNPRKLLPSSNTNSKSTTTSYHSLEEISKSIDKTIQTDTSLPSIKTSIVTNN